MRKWIVNRLRELADALDEADARPRYTRPAVPANSMFKGIKKARYVPWRDEPRYDPRDFDLFADYDEEEMFYRDPEF